ncbi:hypothetical protein ABEB36_009428 [Hypothenemus hampei]|uniref:Uncharacterized protein n=1 Tax=Hypothenemus hampei TaxID=57062 RepID=A0ABD1EGC1_HYPHA
MILRKGTKWILVITLLFQTENVKSQGERTYDTNEWIPIMTSSSAVQGFQSEATEENSPNQRILSLEVPPQQNYLQTFNRQRKPTQQFIREIPEKQGLEQPRPRKLKFSPDYKYETPPPPPARQQVNYYTTEGHNPYIFQQAQRHVSRPNKQRPLDNYVPVPSSKPKAPAPNAQSQYEQYQLPFNTSFYQSLNPAAINNDFYKAISKNNSRPIEQLQSSSILSNPAPIPSVPVEQESVQLVYVPVETLKPAKQSQINYDSNHNYQKVEAPKREQIPLESLSNADLNLTPTVDQSVYHQPLTSYEFQYPPVSTAPRQEKLVAVSTSKPSRLENIEQDYAQQTYQAQRLQQQLDDNINPLTQDLIYTTTEKPKRKAHQPPLAVFLESEVKADVSDVLNILKGAKSIAVQDSITPNSPRIFIGPANLNSAYGYTMFPLPYLNNINGNRIERKIDQLPFFVAPVSYKAPSGYAKIALPSPHVGSIVISVPRTTTPKPTVYNQETSLNPYLFSAIHNSDGFSSEKPKQILETNRQQFQSTFAPRVTESPVITPLRDVYQQSAIDDINDQKYNYYNPQIPEQQKDTTIQKAQKQPISNFKEQAVLPNVTPIDLAITEFELGQINNDFQHTKVKHSTTRPLTSNDEERIKNLPSLNSESIPVRSATSRGRVRGRGRSTTTKIPTIATTAAPTETERYTVLEEFISRDITKAPSTESYKISTTEYQTEAPRRFSTTYAGNAYLPERNLDNASPSLLYENTQLQFEVPKVVSETPKTQNRVQTQSADATEIETIPANVYNLQQPQIYESSAYETPLTSLTYADHTSNEKPSIKENSIRQQSHRFRPDVISYENREPNQGTSTLTPNYFQYEEIKKSTAFPQQENYDQSSSKTINAPDLQQDKSNEEAVEGPPGFLNNLYQPSFDQTYISLQDQAVRSLLVPNLLAPPDIKETNNNVRNDIQSSTEMIIESTSTESEPISTTRAFKTRGRGRPRPTTTTSGSTITTTTAATLSRRTSNRRRPITRTSTERNSPSPEYGSKEDSGSSGSTIQQRFKTRGRPLYNEISDRVSTTENDIRAVKDYNPTRTVSREPIAPQTVTQFEYPVEEQQIITLSPRQEVREYPHIVTSTESQEIILDYDNTKTVGPTPIVDVQGPQVNSQDVERTFESRKTEKPTYLRYNSIKSGGVLNNNEREEETTTTVSNRGKIRTRGRSRFATSTSTTTRAPSRTSSRLVSNSPARVATQNEEQQEFYGFTRQPNFTPIQTNQVTPRSEEAASVRFVGEIRPKYTPRTTTPLAEDDDETTRPRIRTRTRPPIRKPEYDNSRDGDQGTRRPTTRTRGRGQYRPDNVKRDSDDEDVANQNYPATFLQKLEVSSSRPRTTQALVDEMDQTPYASIHRPKFMKPDEPNSIVSNEKYVNELPASSSTDFSQLFIETTTLQSSIGKSEALALIKKEEPEEIKKSKRKGVWKVVRHKSADPLEASESQSFQNVLNSFDTIQKIDPYMKSTVTEEKPNVETSTENTSTEKQFTTELNEEITTTTMAKAPQNIFDTIYEMFGIFGGSAPKNTTSPIDSSVTTTINPIYPEEITESQTTTQIIETTTKNITFTGITEIIHDNKGFEESDTPDTLIMETTLPPKSTIKPYEVDRRDVKEIHTSTSTSTEVSQETEICYKGRCVKSRDRQILK